MDDLTSRVSVALEVHRRLLPSDPWGQEDQLHLEGQGDLGAQGSQEHQQCQEHPVGGSRREDIRTRGRQAGGNLTHLEEPSPGKHSQQTLWLQESHQFQDYPEKEEGAIIKEKLEEVASSVALQPSRTPAVHSSRGV